MNFLFQFSEPIQRAAQLPAGGWAFVKCEDSAKTEETDVTAYHRIDKNRLYFDDVPLPLDDAGGPNDKNRVCWLRIMPGVLTDLDGLKFGGLERHEVIVADAVAPRLESIRPENQGPLGTSYSVGRVWEVSRLGERIVEKIKIQEIFCMMVDVDGATTTTHDICRRC